MATFIVGIANETLLNIEGYSNTVAMNEILEIVIYALLKIRSGTTIKPKI